MSIKKQYLKNNEKCKITFTLSEKVKGIDSVRIIGDFNNWDTNSEPMKKLKTGGFSHTMNLTSGKSYQFRYLINDAVWENDPESDQFVPNGIGQGESNSVIII